MTPNFLCARKASSNLGLCLGRIGSLEVRLAATQQECEAAQSLRYRVFYEEMAAKPDRIKRRLRRDQDRFDPVCDHLIVVDRKAANGYTGSIVGTYRLLREDCASQTGGFYSQREYDVNALIANHPNKRFLELGRSCVLPSYRNRRTMELLWHGIWTYARHHKSDVMFGCASLPGTDPVRLSDQFATLQATSKTPKEWLVRAHKNDGFLLPSRGNHSISQGLRKLPPLIKGYLRLGAYIGDGVVIDHEFGTTDVFIVLPVSAINPRYLSYFGENATRHAA